MKILVLEILLIGSPIIYSSFGSYRTEKFLHACRMPVNHFMITHGFFNAYSLKYIVSLHWICEEFREDSIGGCCGKNPANLALCHFLWQLTRIGFNYSRDIDPKTKWFVNMKFYSFDYGIGNYFVRECVEREHFNNKLIIALVKKNIKNNDKNNHAPRCHVCIVERISWFSTHGGLEHKYSNKTYSLWWSWAVGLSIPTSSWPDIILVYTPLIFYSKSGFYCRLHLIQFSILNLISTIFNIYDERTLKLSNAVSEWEGKMRAMYNLAKPGTVGDVIANLYGSKTFFFKELLLSILYNVTIEMGYDWQFYLKKISKRIL